MKKWWVVETAVIFLSLCLARVAIAETIVSQGLSSNAYSASSSNGAQMPGLAFDGDLGTVWNSGAHSVGWIEVDLGQSVEIAEMLLSIEQLPTVAVTTHQIWTSSSSIGANTSNASLSYTFHGITVDESLLHATFSSPLIAQYVQVRTIESPSWVAWNEIQVMSVSPVPEPSTILLFGTGMAGVAGAGVRRKIVTSAK